MLIKVKVSVSFLTFSCHFFENRLTNTHPSWIRKNLTSFLRNLLCHLLFFYIFRWFTDTHRKRNWNRHWANGQSWPDKRTSWGERGHSTTTTTIDLLRKTNVSSLHFFSLNHFTTFKKKKLGTMTKRHRTTKCRADQCFTLS